MIQSWLALKEGDIVELVAPGSASQAEAITKAQAFIRSWGLVPRMEPNTFGSHPFHANEDSIRLKYFLKALKAKDSKLVWCFRGGYGAIRLIPDLLKQKAPKLKYAKPVLGYSDITSLHLFLQEKWKWCALHGPLLDPVADEKYSVDQIQELKEVLFGRKTELQFHLEPMNSLASKKRKIQGLTAGGNLVVFASHLGTRLAPKGRGKILFFEDTGERGYRVDRKLEQLKQAGVFENCEAVVFGEFLKGDEKDGKNFVSFALERFSQNIKVPCFQGLPVGHGDFNRILPLGQKAELVNKILTVKTGAVT